MTDDARVQDMLANAILGAHSVDRIATDLRAFLAEHGLDPDDVEAIAATPARLRLYRHLVRNNVADVVARMMPRTRARLNRMHAGAFEATVEAFLDEAAPRTHYLRDVPHELLSWAAPRWRGRAELPPYLVDLGSYELVEFALAAAPSTAAEGEREVAEVALNRPLVFVEAKRLAHYAFAVHELPASLDDTSQPEERHVTLLVYRDPEHKVRFLDVSPLAAGILQHLFDGLALGGAVSAACEAADVGVTDAILADTARLLADLGARGVLLGGRRD